MTFYRRNKYVQKHREETKTLALIVVLGGSIISLVIGLGASLSTCARSGRYSVSRDYVGEAIILFLICLAVAIVFFISSWVLYGFGQLIENTQNIENKLLGNSLVTQYTNGQTMANIQLNNKTICPKCGTANESDSLFCYQCGECIK